MDSSLLMGRLYFLPLLQDVLNHDRTALKKKKVEVEAAIIT